MTAKISLLRTDFPCKQTIFDKKSSCGLSLVPRTIEISKPIVSSGRRQKHRSDGDMTAFIQRAENNVMIRGITFAKAMPGEGGSSRSASRRFFLPEEVTISV